MSNSALIKNHLSIDAKGIAWALTQNINDTVIVIFSIPISIFVASEFSGGTIKNVISKGFSRTKIYFSKFVISLLMMLFMLMMYMIVSIITGGLLWNFKTDNTMLCQIIRYMSLQLLSSCALAGLYVTFAILIKNSAISVAVNILITFMGKLPIWIIDAIRGDNLHQRGYYWVVNNMLNLTTLQPSTVEIQRIIISSLIYLTVFSFYVIKKLLLDVMAVPYGY